MSAFLYTAVDPSGKRQKGLLDAASAAEARAQLRAQSLLPITVKATRARTGLGARPTLFKHKLTLKRLTLITRQLATLVGASVRIDDALKIVADQQSNARDGSFLLNLRSTVQDGASFADALDTEPASFGAAYRASVRAGERAGHLGQVLNQLADHVEEQSRNRQSIQLALIYPALLALVSLGVILALLGFVVPDIVRVFTARGADLPALTRALIGLSDGMQRYGPALAVVLVTGGLGLAALLRRPVPRSAWHRWLASGRMTRGLVRKVNSRPVHRHPRHAAAKRRSPGRGPARGGRHREQPVPAGPHRYPDPRGRGRRVAVVSGETRRHLLADACRDDRQWRSGRHPEREPRRAAADQSRELKAAVATLVALVEPGVLLVMGGIVMLLVLAILMPIMQLNSLVG